MAETKPFGPIEEKTIIALAFDNPDFFISVFEHLNVDLFEVPEVRYVFAIIQKYYQEHDVIISRNLAIELITKTLTVDDDGYESVLALLQRQSNPREVPLIKDNLIAWAREQAYRRLWSEEGLKAFEEKNYDRINDMIESARRITSFTDGETMWFFDSVDDLLKRDCEEKLTCGLEELDAILNDGGPTKRDVVCFMANSGVGKSLLMVNSGAAAIMRELNVLHVTLEMSRQKIGQRYLGVFTDIPISKRFDRAADIKNKLRRIKDTYRTQLVIREFPPDEISVNAVYQIIDQLKKTHRWHPDMVIIDYLELMMSRTAQYNKDDYTRQKHVATEVRGLAKNEDVLVITATQANRDPGVNKTENNMDLNRMAESYAKAMPLDYVISLNQSQQEYEATPPRLRCWVAKNRNGPRAVLVRAAINYETMKVTAFDSEGIE